ncbi:hypothetical protein SGRA_1490 [Saprospira grandis str. Lewin]|uniref:Uncharacterized protein n=1 Tax=Saprospira grandis (strain Lewin) TaxID=984262 RepID=H6L953_SAPGL|nr:hypothetical protein SGRA_1490 [Saprospira grandis str. Lewin]
MVHFFGFAGPKGRRPSDVQQWPLGQTQAAKLPQGRANSELRNVAPTSAARRRPQKSSELRNDNKAFRPQFDDRRE